jgi:hypothetical protein
VLGRLRATGAARTALWTLKLIHQRKGQQLWLDIASDRFQGKAITERLRTAIEHAEEDKRRVSAWGT